MFLTLPLRPLASVAAFHHLRGVATHERYVFCDPEHSPPPAVEPPPRRAEVVTRDSVLALLKDRGSGSSDMRWSARITVDPTSGELLVDGQQQQLKGSPLPSARARAAVHSALRGRPGYVGSSNSSGSSNNTSVMVFPVAVRERVSFPSATNITSIRAARAPDRGCAVRFRVDDLHLPLQVKRRLLALLGTRVHHGVAELKCDSRDEPAHNERKAKSILTRLIQEAWKATGGPEHWASSWLKLPLPDHEDHLEMLEETYASEQAASEALLRRWCVLRSRSTVPVYAEKLYDAYPASHVEEAKEEVRQVNVDEHGFTVL